RPRRAGGTPCARVRVARRAPGTPQSRVSRLGRAAAAGPRASRAWRARRRRVLARADDALDRRAALAGRFRYEAGAHSEPEEPAAHADAGERLQRREDEKDA